MSWPAPDGSVRAPGRDAVVPASRVPGLDLARFLALIGMMATHLWIGFGVGGGETPVFVDAISGKAAALFAVLAGAGIALTTNRALAEGRVSAARLAVFGRGLALVVIGLTLGLAPGIILVILVYYGLTFWLAVPVLRWHSGVLLAVAGVWAFVWPILSALLRGPEVDRLEVGSASWFDLADPVVFLRGVFVSGAYPALTWIVYVMVGIVVGRLVIAARDTGTVRALGIRLAAIGTMVSAGVFATAMLIAGPLGGLAAYAADTGTSSGIARDDYFVSSYGVPTDDSWWLLASPAPHSGSFPDLAITAGLAVAVIGALLVVGQTLGRVGERVLGPVLAAGGAPLTVYTLHVIVAAFAAALAMPDGYLESGEQPWWFVSGWIWLVHIVGALLVGTGLMLARSRGPLERFVGWTGRSFAQQAGDRPPGPPSGGPPRPLGT